MLAACSGGADSVALFTALVEAGVPCVAGHVDHGLRAGSAGEAEGVRALAKRLGARFELERLEGLETSAEGLEGAARRARHAAFVRLAARTGATLIATGHTRRDQAETILLRLARGAGPGALASVRRRRELGVGLALVRPLLDVSREDTEAFCRARALPFVLDPHNLDPGRTRARLRSLWPALLGLNPRLEEALAGAADAFADEDALLQAAALDELRESGLRASRLRALHPALLRRALLHAANEAGLRPERAHLEGLRGLLAKGAGALDLPGGRAAIVSGRLTFGVAKSAPPPEAVIVPAPGVFRFGERALRVSLAPPGVPVDLARAPFPWVLRVKRAGDRFRPARGREKKLSDLLIDAKIPREARDRLAVLEDLHRRLFWVEGLRPGAASDSPAETQAFIELLPEMRTHPAAFIRERRDDPPSATIPQSHDEEPR